MNMEHEMVLAENEILKHEVARLREREAQAKKLLMQASESINRMRHYVGVVDDASASQNKRLRIIAGYTNSWMAYSNWFARILTAPKYLRRISEALYAN